jgi:hypothetical protein
MFPARPLLLLLLGVVPLGACSLFSEPAPMSAAVQRVETLSDAQVTAALRGHEVSHWDEWVKSATLSEAQQARLAAGETLAGIAPTPIRHDNGFLEVDEVTFERIHAGELAFHIDFSDWLAAGLYDDRIPAHRAAAISWIRNNPERAIDQIPALRTAGSTNAAARMMDTATLMDTGVPMDSGIPMDTGTEDTGTEDTGTEDTTNCLVTCDVVVSAPSETPTSDGQYVPDNSCGDQYDDELWYWHVSGGAHVSSARADGGMPLSQDAGSCSCSTDTGTQTTTATELRVTATCAAGASDDSQPMDCPSDLEWKLEGWGESQQSLYATADAQQTSNDDYYNGCADAAWSAQASITARCGVVGSGYSQVTRHATHEQSCNTASTLQGSISGSASYSSADGGSWEFSGGGGAGASITTSCSDNITLSADATVDCNARGPETVLTSSDDPSGNIVWAGVGGGSFQASATSVASVINGSDGEGALSEADINGMASLTVEVRECFAWSDDDATAMLGCTIQAADPTNTPDVSSISYGL